MRNRRLPPWIAAAAAAALALTACGGEDGTPSLSDVSPLTGLPAEASKLQRPPLIIKIDNVDAARPQAGLQEADIVFEEPVEGGLTRLAAVYQSKDAATRRRGQRDQDHRGEREPPPPSTARVLQPPDQGQEARHSRHTSRTLRTHTTHDRLRHS